MTKENIHTRSVRNGKIEYLRFIFCLCVLLFHICKYIMELPDYESEIHLSFFSHGAMGVEFFFLVSGFLMAKTAYIYSEFSNLAFNDQSLSENYLKFLGKKYFSIFPYHFIAFVLAFTTYVVSKHMGISSLLMYAANSLPNFLLIEMSGINLSNPNHIEWYISCMLFAMAIIYPLCIRYYHSFTKFFAPLIAILLLGYMQHTTGRLTGVSQWSFICYKSMLRAIAEIALGTTAFELSRYIKKRQWNKIQKIIFTLTELCCFILIIIFVLFTFTVNMEILILFLLFILVTLAFSSISYGAKLFDNRFFYFLGSISLPIYLAQLPAIYIVSGYFGTFSTKSQIIISLLLTMLFSALVKIFGDILKTFFNGGK